MLMVMHYPCSRDGWLTRRPSVFAGVKSVVHHETSSMNSGVKNDTRVDTVLTTRGSMDREHASAARHTIQYDTIRYIYIRALKR